jgi:Uma2 family endonuclease
MKFAELDLNKVYTYADYFKWKFEERVELIKGKIFRMSPAPSTIHQKLCGEISGQIWSCLRDKKCQVFSAPFDVRLPRKSSDDKEIYTVLQPDVCVICDPAKLDKRGCLGAPDIVVEVLSPGNNAKELKNKYEVYEEAGVKEYWIVQPQYCSFVQYKLENGKYQPSRQLTTGDVVTTDILEGFVLDLTALFAEIDVDEMD